MPGNSSVFYGGDAERTMLGLAMAQADESLGPLAFSSTKDIQSVVDQVPGFHSLPELYPERYAAHPTQGNYPGANTVFLHSAIVGLDWARAHDRLDFNQTLFNVRFDNATPAEELFGAFFVEHFNEI